MDCCMEWLEQTMKGMQLLPHAKKIDSLIMWFKGGCKHDKVDQKSVPVY